PAYRSLRQRLRVNAAGIFTPIVAAVRVSIEHTRAGAIQLRASAPIRGVSEQAYPSGIKYGRMYPDRALTHYRSVGLQVATFALCQKGKSNYFRLSGNAGDGSERYVPDYFVTLTGACFERSAITDRDPAAAITKNAALLQLLGEQRHRCAPDPE